MRFRGFATAIALCGVLSIPQTKAENWSGFRGQGGQGISLEKQLPVTWSPTENIAWKSPLPGEGFSSPIVWGDHAFVTTATDEGRSFRVLCLQAQTGRILWDKEVFKQPAGHKQEKNSYATATPTTDGERVYVLAADGSFAALNFDGKILWSNRDFPFFSEHGLGTSPLLYRDLLIAAFDGSSDGADKALGWQKPWDQAKIIALDKRTGKVRWVGKRGLSRIAHETPAVLSINGKDQLVSAAGDVVQGFNLETGERLWSVASPGEGVVPSVVVGDGLVYTASGFGNPTIRAIRPDGTGGASPARIVWEMRKRVPMISSFAYVKPYLYTVTESGIAQCLKADTGESVWEERLDGGFFASPVAAEGRLYLLSEEGECVVLQTSPKFKVLARNRLAEKCRASLAVSSGRIYLRTEKNLYCIGKAVTTDTEDKRGRTKKTTTTTAKGKAITTRKSTTVKEE